MAVLIPSCAAVLLYWNHQHEAKNTRLHDVMSVS